MRRVLTALLLAPAVVALILWAPPVLFAVLAAGVAVLGALEFFALAAHCGAAPYRWIGGLFVALVALHVALAPGRLAEALFAAVAVVLLRALSRPERLPEAFADAGATLLAILYLGLLLGALAGLRTLWGPRWLLFLLAVVWAGDVAALYVGKLLGRHAMAPHVSPKKTWEGAAGSLLASALVGAAFGHWFTGPDLAPAAALWAALAVAVNIAAQCGDLVESLFKRAAGVKDSGALLPGHGGVLDRVDALLLAAPVLWYALPHLLAGVGLAH